MAEKWGYINREGAWVIAPQFEDAFAFINGMAAAKSDGLWGFIGRNGKYVVKPQFQHAGISTSRHLRVQKVGESKLELLRPDMSSASKYRFDSIDNFSCGLCRVEIDGKHGYIDYGGELIVAPQYESASEFSEGLAIVRHNRQSAFIAPDGSRVIESEHYASSGFHEGLATISADPWHEGKIDRAGRVAIDLKYTRLGDFSEGLCRGTLNGRTFFINRREEGVFSQAFTNAAAFSESRSFVQVEGSELWGIIDRRGRFIVKPKYKYNSWFQNCISVVKSRDYYGAIDPDGKVVIDPKFKSLRGFYDEWSAACIET